MIEPPPILSQSPGGRWLEKFRQWAKGLRILPGRGYRVKETTGGVILEIEQKGGGGAGGTTAAAVITEIGHDNFFKAQLWGGSDFDGDIVDVAKEFEFWQDPTSGMGMETDWDGQTATYDYDDDSHRTSTDPLGNVRNQIAVPRYYVGQSLKVSRLANAIPAGDDEADVSWIEASTRYWIKDPVE